MSDKKRNRDGRLAVLKDRISGLERQNEHLKEQIVKLREQNTHLNEANRQLRMAADAVMISVAKRYGEGRKDEETGALLGYRLNIGKGDVRELEAWEVRVEPQGEDHIVGVFPREEAEGTQPQPNAVGAAGRGTTSERAEADNGKAEAERGRE